MEKEAEESKCEEGRKESFKAKEKRRKESVWSDSNSNINGGRLKIKFINQRHIAKNRHIIDCS